MNQRAAFPAALLLASVSCIGPTEQLGRAILDSDHRQLATAMGERLNVVDSSGLTDADWAAVNRVNRACELGGAVAFWEELEKLDDVPLQLRVLGAFFPELVREVIEEEMTEHGLTIDDLRKALLGINRFSKFSGPFLFGCWPISGEWSCVVLAAAGH